MSSKPSTLFQCKSCVMDTSDPNITFKNGTCNHCISARKMLHERMLETENLSHIVSKIQIDGIKGDYDVLLGLSGGVDSSMCLHHIIELGLRPLCFSIDNGWNNPETDANIMKLVETLKVPFYRYTIDLEKFRELQIAFIHSCTPNIEIPTDHILMAATYEVARENGIKWIISGGNVATESIMPEAWGYNARDLRFIKDVYKKHTHKKLVGLPMISLFRYLRSRFLKGIRIVNLLDYFEYNRDASKVLLAERYGWVDYGEKHCENRFTQWFQNYYLTQFFGIDKRKAHYSSLINSKQMTKAEAVIKLQEPLEFKQILGIEGRFTPKTHKDFKNSEFYWNFFSFIYRICKF